MKCEGCKKRIAISDAMTCKWCEKDFCMYCRLPEEHSCENIENLKDLKKQILGEQLVKIEKKMLL